MIIIEVTKRYIIGDCTLDNIIDSYIDSYEMNDECDNFSEFISEELESYCEDERVVNGDIKDVKKICEMQLEINKIKEKALK